MGETLLPHLAQLKKLSQLLRLRSYHFLIQADYPIFFNSLTLQVELQRTLSREPFSISQLVKWAISAALLDDIGVALSYEEIDSRRRQELLTIVDSIDTESDLLPVLIGERMFVMDLITQFLQSNAPSSLQDRLSGLIVLEGESGTTQYLVTKDYATGSLKSDFESAKSFFNLAMQESSLGKYPDFWRTFEKLNVLMKEIQTRGEVEYSGNTYSIQDFEKLLQQGMRPSKDSKSYKVREAPVLSRLTIPMLLKAFEKHPSRLTKARTIEASAKILQFLEDTESDLPRILDVFPEDFRASWPVDPYTGEGLLYEGYGSEFKVFSYGRENLKTLKGEGEPDFNPGNPEIETVVHVH